MAKQLYLFAVGGTGSRILEALVYLLAGGADMNGFDINPVIIDPHVKNAGLQRVLGALGKYEKFRNKLFPNNNNDINIKYFKTKINPHISITLNDDNKLTNQNFKDFIGYSNLNNKKIKYLVETLYPDEHLDLDMSAGFIGNPNIGSAVFANLKDNPSFVDLLNTMHTDKGNRIMILSSIFGGTGAAGFPTICKIIRNYQDNGGNKPLEDIPIGAVSVLPYFKIDTKNNPNAQINSNEFISKTNHALHYYNDFFNSGKNANIIYYVGDDQNIMDNNVAVTSSDTGMQDNKSHFVEWVGATAILKFSKLPDNALFNIDGTNNKIFKGFTTNCFGFDTKDNTNQIKLETLEKDYCLPMYRLYFLTIVLNYIYTNSDLFQKQPWYNSIKLVDNKDVFKGYDFYSFLDTNGHFIRFIDEIKTNCRSLDFFNDKTDGLKFDEYLASFCKDERVKKTKPTPLERLQGKDSFDSKMNNKANKINIGDDYIKFISIIEKVCDDYCVFAN